MDCFRSCCHASCWRQHKSEYISKQYNSFGGVTPSVDMEMLTASYYQQPVEGCPDQIQPIFHSSIPSITGLALRQQDGVNPDTHSTSSDRPSLHISVHHNVQRGVLAVQLHTISGLSVKNGQGIYIIATLFPLKEQIKSITVPGSLNFAINQTLEFPLGSVLQQTLKISIYSVASTDLLGTSTVSLNKLDKSNSPIVHKLDICKKDKTETETDERGEVMLSLCYNEPKAAIQGIVLKAKGLKTRASIMPDPYVKITLNFGGAVKSTWRSTYKTRTASPVYNESFCLDVSGMDPDHVSIQAEVSDHNKLLRNYFIGCVRIGTSSPSESGRKHWAAMIEHQGESISYWHSLVAKQ